jgi:hypothetical protein
MTTSNSQNPIPKAIALIVVCACVTFLFIKVDAAVLRRLDTMSAADFVQYERLLHHHSVLFRFLAILMAGVLFTATVDLITYIVRLFFKATMPIHPTDPTPGLSSRS